MLGSGQPAYSPKNGTDTVAYVYAETGCLGTFVEMGPGQNLGPTVQFRSVSFI